MPCSMNRVIAMSGVRGTVGRVEVGPGHGVVLLRLRGGQTGLNRTIVVPSKECPSIRDGLEEACMIDELKLKQGGEEETWIIGRWKVSEEGGGSFSRLKIAEAPSAKAPTTEEDDLSTFDISDSKWSFYKVCLHNIQGVAVGCKSIANVLMDNCLVGGGSPEPNGQAKIGIIMSNRCRLELNQSTIAWCENFGVDIDAQTHMQLLQCSGSAGLEFRSAMAVSPTSRNVNSKMPIDERARYTSQIFLRNSSMDRNVWFGGRRPVRNRNDPEDLVGDSTWSSENQRRESEM
ncbi:hypothetical protein GUITHDRAFT_116051 [Guillardia theta CCMP2712]|uniref:Uncharacterized protein n=1 Tax=Guillardia theta (strain CCMP2712) TaxID=905079 RepID=L1IN98_GUITC|nr:hypothetical protein GUITHDRAFT_116051 [Guillardia theta CCMP2712]EKX37743.1 hypothetical protein GUITHDRAFT_116051 [Guillardia theta CCMP2712]|eukprot:XP_005824723.1 hypothetical protein GUITHDRAFT_116051 [Guillardia theta CCMP2712]